MLENDDVYSDGEDDDNGDILNYITESESDEGPGDAEEDAEEESENISSLFVSTRSGRKTTSWKSFLYK